MYNKLHQPPLKNSYGDSAQNSGSHARESSGTHSLAYFIESLATKFGSRIAITYYHRFRCKNYTYQELFQLALKCSAYLLDSGIKKDDRILIYGENCPEWVVVLLSCGITGIILVPIDSKSLPEFVEKIRQETEAKCLISDRLLVLKDSSVKQLMLDDLFSKIESFDPLSRIDPLLSGDNILEILYTSGTTSAPKGAVIRHRNLVSSIWGIRQQIVCDKKSRFLSMLPLSHVLEQNSGCLSILRFGARIVYTKQVRFSRIIEIMIREKITNIVAVPAILKRFSNKIVEEFEARKKTTLLSNLLKLTNHLPLLLKRFLTLPIRKKIGLHLSSFFCGGAPLDLKTETFWENLGIKVIQGYGLTESCAMSCANTLSNRKKGSVGKPIAIQQLSLGENDEILLSGENISSEYYNAPELNEKYFRNGWFHTGDVGRLDPEGNLYIIGRLKEMILTSNGLNVFPTDIEELLNNLPGIQESAVFEDPDRDGTLIAGVITKPGFQQNSIHSTLQTLNQQLAPHQRLSKLIQWAQSTLPKTNSLKIKRGELPKIYQSFSKKQTSDARSSQDPLLNILAEMTQQPAQNLSPELTLVKDLGLDSLSLVNLVIKLESQFRTELDESGLTGECTIEQLRHFITTSQKVNKPPPLQLYWFSFPLKFISRIFRSVLEQSLLRWWIKIDVREDIPSIPTNRPTIFIANHTSHLDTLAVFKATPICFKRHLIAAAAHDYFFGENKKRGCFMNLFGISIFPFYRDKYFSENLKNIGELFKQGKHLLIFPEGTRSRNGKMASFKNGIGMIVKEMDAQVVPIYIQGAYELWPSSASFPKRGNVTVQFGQPLYFDSSQTPVQITEQLESAFRKTLANHIF